MCRFSLKSSIIFFTIFIQIGTNSSEINSFGSSFSGHDPANKTIIRRIQLLPYFAASDGFVFAFSAIADSQEPALVIVYRPSSPCNLVNMKPVGHAWYYPTVAPGWKENVYLESYYSNGCIPIKKYDMIGLYFPNEPSIVRTFGKTQIDTSKQCFATGVLYTFIDANTDNIFVDVTFDPVRQPYSAEIEVFYYSNEQNSNPTTTCEKGHLIPSNRTVSIRPPTTTPPLKGLPGFKGEVGETGPTGETGDAGSIGKTGKEGLQGDLGLPGLQGYTGARGPNGTQGDTGPMGSTGLIGAKGQSGVKGIKGDTGPQGDHGYPGRNVTVVRPRSNEVQTEPDNDPLWDDPYFGEDRAIWALFIWLAILTFVALVTLIALVVSGTWLNKL